MPAAPSTGTPPAQTPARSAATVSPASCPSEAETNGSEIEGTGAGVSLWALLFLTGPTLKAGKETKIVWRMTGDGDLAIQATGPDGHTVSPTWLTSHDGSTWTRPGDEWGTGWVFPVPGCWTVHAVRDGGATATLTLRVGE